MLDGCWSLFFRDIFTVQLTEQSEGGTAEQQPTAADAEGMERFVCPVTHLHSTRYPFVAISSCGHVVSERAVKQVSSSSLVRPLFLKVAK